MSNELKKIKGRISNKHGTELDWLKSIFVDGDESKGLVSNPFYPLAGELIIYDPDSIYTYPRFKIGRWINPEDESLGTVRLDLLDFVDENVNILTTSDKTVVGAINELNDKALANADGILLANLTDISYEGAKDGIHYDGTFWAATDGFEKDILEIPIGVNLPIAAGENVEFEVDEENRVVKINATGGSETFDKIQNIYDMESTIEIDPERGVYEWSDRYFTDGEDDNTLHISAVTKIYPFVAGDNVTFTHDTENQVVKINAAGGEIDTSKFVSKYNIETSPSTTVLDVINAIENAGGTLNEWNVIVLTGYIAETWGLQISHYGSTVYNIQGVNLNNMKTVSSTTSWSSVTLGSFQVMFKSAIPYCDASNAGQFLRVDANGNPAWSAIPNAEEATF